ncbi:MAG: PEGA domain-containing protein [Candidatus Doudnabacteria bacterium]|nr:PEGA domain-containing protein [Candidatus Doudnabacteria bacterium]
MTLKTRFTLIGIGIVIFLIIVPPLVLFASGFQIDWSNFAIVKTGTLVVETEPGKALVYLSDKKQRGATPSTIRFLLPKDYQVRIEKPGYQTWTKRLSVKSQLVTWANLNRKFIALFLSEPLPLVDFSSDQTFLSSDQRELVFSVNGEFFFLSAGSEKPVSLGPATALAPPFEFNAGLVWDNGQKVYEALKKFSEINLSIYSPTPKISTNGTFTILASADQLWLVTSSGTEVIATDIDAYLLENDILWFIKNSSLQSLNLTTKELRTVKQDLPRFKKGQIIRSSNYVFLLLDGDLYFANESLDKIAQAVVFSSWNYGADKLLIATNNEISLFDPQNQKVDLIHRSVSNISNPVFNAETGYVFFSNEGRIKAIELDGRDQRNIFEFGEAGLGFTLSNNGKLLYVFSDENIRILEIR